MKVHILIERVDYEGDYILCVYQQKAHADEHAERLNTGKSYKHTKFVVEEWEVTE